MTRDEAIEKVDGLEPFDLPTRRGQNELLVDKLVALGMLKLEEPKSVNERAVDALFAGSQSGVITPRHALDALSAANLKIVEK